MYLHFRLYATMVVIVGGVLFAGNVATAEWTEPVCLTELNDFANGYLAGVPCVSGDELSIVFTRQVNSSGLLQIFEASREEVGEPFGAVRMHDGLNPLGVNWIFGAFMSTDGFRLYYNLAVPENGQWGGFQVIKMATRNSVFEGWQEERSLLELHVPKTSDSSATLTSDELTIMWLARRPITSAILRVFTATRTTTNVPFSNEREVPELSELGAVFPHLSSDGLRVYFTAPNAETGKNNLFKAARESLDAPFTNFEVLDDFCGPDQGASRSWLSPDEKTIYFNTARGETLDEIGIFVSYWIDDPYDVAVESIEAAIAAKREAIAVITSGLDKERAALEALNELGETGDIDPRYIEAARRYVLHAIRRQMKAIAELEKSIRELEKALDELEGTGNTGKKPGKPAHGPKKPRVPRPS